MKKITLLLSFVACVFFSQAITSVANIAALKTANSTLGFGTGTIVVQSTETYTVTGEVTVTFVSTSSTGVRTLYVQDSSGAFMVYDSGKLFTTTPTLYCGLSGLTGTVKSYYGILELIPNVAPNAPTSAGNGTSPFPTIVTTLDNLINYPMQVCTVKNVTISDQVSGGTGMFVASKNFPLSVSGVSSTTVLRTSYADCNYVTTAIPTAAQNLTGIALPYQASATASYIVDFIPRSSSDFSIATGLSNPQENQTLTVSASKNQLKIFNAADGSNVEIFSALGSRVQNSVLSNGLVELNNLSNGMYIVRIGNQTAKFKL